MISDFASATLKNMLRSKKFAEASSFLQDYYEYENASSHYFNLRLKAINIQDIQPEISFSNHNPEAPILIRNSRIIRYFMILLVLVCALPFIPILLDIHLVGLKILAVFLFIFIVLVLLIRGIIDRGVKLRIDEDKISIDYKVKSHISGADILSVFLIVREDISEPKLVIFKKNTEVPEVWDISYLELLGQEIGFLINHVLKSES